MKRKENKNNESHLGDTAPSCCRYRAKSSLIEIQVTEIENIKQTIQEIQNHHNPSDK